MRISNLQLFFVATDLHTHDAVREIRGQLQRGRIDFGNGTIS